MAKSTRVLQPGIESVLCIRMGYGLKGTKVRGYGVRVGPDEGDQALRACHCATLVRGLLSMSFQCFTSAGPLFHDR